MKLGWAPEPGSYCHRKPGWWLQMASLQIITEKYHHGSCSAVAKYHHLSIISAIYCQYSWKLSSWKMWHCFQWSQSPARAQKAIPSSFIVFVSVSRTGPINDADCCRGVNSCGVHNNLNTVTKYRSKDAGNYQDFCFIQNPKKEKNILSLFHFSAFTILRHRM